MLRTQPIAQKKCENGECRAQFEPRKRTARFCTECRRGAAESKRRRIRYQQRACDVCGSNLNVSVVLDRPTCEECKYGKKIARLRNRRADIALKACEGHFPGLRASLDRKAYFHDHERALDALWAKIVALPSTSIQGADRFGRVSALAKHSTVLDNAATVILASAPNNEFPVTELEADPADVMKRDKLCEFNDDANAANGGDKFGIVPRAFWDSN